MAVRGNFYGRSRQMSSRTDSPVSPVRGGGAVNQQVMSLARNLANNIIRQRELANRRARLGRIYTSFDPVDDILPNNQETVTRGIFSGNTGTLTGYFTSSTLTNAQQSYFADVYDKNPVSDSTAVEQFSIAYGHYNGSGSKDTTGNLNNDTPSRAIYKQYAQLLLPPDDKKFTFGDGADSDSIYVINFNRARYREKIDPGNIEINLKKAAVLAPAAQGHNHMKLYNAMRVSYAADATLGLQARSSEAVKSTYYFVRMKNAEYNYSNNPSFITGSLGQLAYNTFVYDPQVYITTAGLYNERKELLAVAKLSQPLLKSFTREVLIKVKLDF